MDTLLLVDGNALMHRAYHALPSFKTKSGIYTNVIYGFFGMLHGAIKDFQPTHVAIAFDTPARTFRQDLNEQYQAQRPHMEDDFKSQIPILHELLDDAGICRRQLDGYEADDVIGTISKRANDAGMRVLILTGDKDIMQLVNHKTFVLSPQTGVSKIKLYDEPAVKERLGVMPKMIPELKALMGDPSDNYFGAKGIGPKTAIKLLEQFGSVENMLKHTDQIEKPTVRTIIESHVDTIRTSHDIATIRRDVDIPVDLEEARFTGFPQKLDDKLAQYEMKTLRQRLFELPLNLPKAAEKKTEPKKKKEVSTKDQIGLF
ncbi:hypothetical protein HYS00_04820 [Candidatus Microgenomates bacterium]|nr:hypothetical protein [Candidatus Microgenomates bacterium]